MRVLITGGAGFIGSHLCEQLIERGDEVICVDNLFTGSRDNIKDLLPKSNFTFINHDIIDPLYLDQEIDQIYNLACPASPIHYQKNPVRTIKASTIGVINMLGLARAKGARILQASTSEVYGDPEVSPQTESYHGNVSTVGPRACYDEGKRCAETLFFDYHRMHGLEIKIVRIFNTYGPRMAFDDGRVVSNFMKQALSGEPLTIYGDGSQTRSFCFVSDLVDGIILMMNSEIDFVGPVNLGNPDEYKIIDFADKINHLVGGEKRYNYLPLPIDDPKQRRPDITLAKDRLDWEPVVNLDIGLTNMMNDFKLRININI